MNIHNFLHFGSVVLHESVVNTVFHVKKIMNRSHIVFLGTSNKLINFLCFQPSHLMAIIFCYLVHSALLFDWWFLNIPIDGSVVVSVVQEY